MQNLPIITSDLFKLRSKYSILLLQHKLKNSFIVKKWGDYVDVLLFWFLTEDTPKELKKIRRQNLKLEKCTIQKFAKYLCFSNHHGTA